MKISIWKSENYKQCYNHWSMHKPKSWLRTGHVIPHGIHKNILLYLYIFERCEAFESIWILESFTFSQCLTSEWRKKNNAHLCSNKKKQNITLVRRMNTSNVKWILWSWINDTELSISPSASDEGCNVYLEWLEKHFSFWTLKNLMLIWNKYYSHLPRIKFAIGESCRYLTIL